MNKRTNIHFSTAAIAAAATFLLVLCGCDRGLHRDEIVQFFPSYGCYDAGSNSWRCDIRGWVYERGNRARTAALVAGEIFSSEEEDDEDLAAQRAQTFFVDKQRGKELITRIGPVVAAPPPTDDEGFFACQMTLPASAVKAIPAERTTGVRAMTCSIVTPSEGQGFRGPVYLIPPAGLSVISDIDDTIRNFPGDSRKSKIANLFRREFEAVPGMAQVYQHWRSQGAVFHYVSNSAWQFTPWLEKFFEREKFPAGTLHLRAYKIRLPFGVKSWGPTKLEVIDQIIRDFPGRRFVLVGDTSDQDVEIYGHIARLHPTQVERIVLRNTTGEVQDSERMQNAMRGVADSKWMLFDKPREINATAGTPASQVP